MRPVGATSRVALRSLKTWARAVGQVAGRVAAADELAGLGQRLWCHVDTVRSHVSDEAYGFAADINAFIEALRGSHRVAGGEAQLAGGFLLQR